MTTRRRFLLTLGLVSVGVPFSSYGQPKERVWRVGVLGPGRRPASPDMEFFGGLLHGFSALGYAEGRNLLIEWRFADGNYDRLPGLAEELLRIPVDAIVTDGTPATRAAQTATATIPVVFGSAADPVGNGLVASLARPGGNTTGISLFGGETDIAVKVMEFLLAFVPGAKSIAVLWNPSNTSALPVVRVLQSRARAAKIRVVSLEAQTSREIETCFGRMKTEGANGFVWVRDSFLTSQRRQIAELAASHRIPGAGGARTYPEAGGLMSYGSNGWDNLRRTAALVDKIFKGAKPGEIPVEQASKIELVINRKTAKALGLTIPPDLLLLADRVIE